MDYFDRVTVSLHILYTANQETEGSQVLFILIFDYQVLIRNLEVFLINFVHRYFAVHVPYISFVRKTIGILNHGPNPPPVLRLSDGGHVENLGILPLLKLRLKKIITVYGGRASSEQAFCNTLLKALEMARKKLRCSFTGLDGRDITEDIRNELVEKSPGNQPRSYRLVNRKITCLKKITFFHKITLATAGLASSVGRVLDCRGEVRHGFDSLGRINTRVLEVTKKLRYCLCPASRHSGLRVAPG